MPLTPPFKCEGMHRLPLSICRSQHIFIDAGQPGNPYHFTYTCINCTDNQRSFNDGYHVGHHLNSKLHWVRATGTLHQHHQ